MQRIDSRDGSSDGGTFDIHIALQDTTVQPVRSRRHFLITVPQPPLDLAVTEAQPLHRAPAGINQ